MAQMPARKTSEIPGLNDAGLLCSFSSFGASIKSCLCVAWTSVHWFMLLRGNSLSKAMTQVDTLVPHLLGVWIVVPWHGCQIKMLLVWKITCGNGFGNPANIFHHLFHSPGHLGDSMPCSFQGSTNGIPPAPTIGTGAVNLSTPRRSFRPPAHACSLISPFGKAATRRLTVAFWNTSPMEAASVFSTKPSVSCFTSRMRCKMLLASPSRMHCHSRPPAKMVPGRSSCRIEGTSSGGEMCSLIHGCMHFTPSTNWDSSKEKTSEVPWYTS